MKRELNQKAEKFYVERAPRGEPCPFCWGKYNKMLTDSMETGRRYLHAEKGMNALSRREKTYICSHCGRAEGLADMTGITDHMARIAVYNDYQDARRMPVGVPVGVCFGTGEFHPDGKPDLLMDRCKCGGLHTYCEGSICASCDIARPERIGQVCALFAELDAIEDELCLASETRVTCLNEYNRTYDALAACKRNTVVWFPYGELQEIRQRFEDAQEQYFAAQDLEAELRERADALRRRLRVRSQ